MNYFIDNKMHIATLIIFQEASDQYDLPETIISFPNEEQAAKQAIEFLQI